MRWRHGRFSLAAAFALSLAMAGPAAPAHAADETWLHLDRIWSWLATMLPGEMQTSPNVDKCSSIDPNGGGCQLTGGSGERGFPVDPKGEGRKPQRDK